MDDLGGLSVGVSGCGWVMRVGDTDVGVEMGLWLVMCMGRVGGGIRWSEIQLE